MAKRLLTKEYLLSIFDVDLKRGRLFWKKPPKHHNEKKGKEAGSPTSDKKKYWVISINRVKYKRGKLLFFIAYGYMPKPCIDHKNGNSLDDRIKNIREASKLQNNWNRKANHPGKALPMGVRHSPNSSNFQARIGFLGKMIHIGTFSTAESAHNAYRKKRKELYGDFA